jgi:hypothetical protein
VLYLILSTSAAIIVMAGYEAEAFKPDLMDRVIAFLVIPWGLLLAFLDGDSPIEFWAACWHMVWHGEYIDA